MAVLSEALWTRQFDRDPSIVGRTMALSGNRWDAAQRRSVIVRQELTVIGVMPERFQFPYRASSVFPGAIAGIADRLVDCQTTVPGRGQVIARLKPGVSRPGRPSRSSSSSSSASMSPRPVRTGPPACSSRALADEVLGAVHRSLWLLFGAVGLVLAAACANVANLLLARTTARTHEIVTRAALGAGPLRLVRQFLAESLLLALAGGAAGVALALLGRRASSSPSARRRSPAPTRWRSTGRRFCSS